MNRKLSTSAATAAALALALTTSAALAASPTSTPVPQRPPIQRVKPSRTITVKLVDAAHIAAGVRYRVTSQDSDSCTAWAVDEAAMLAAYKACSGRLSEGQARTPTVPGRGLECVPRDVLEVALTSDRQGVVVTLWNADGDVESRRVQGLDDPLSTLWDR